MPPSRGNYSPSAQVPSMPWCNCQTEPSRAVLNDSERNRSDIDSMFEQGSYQGTHLCVPQRLLNQRAFRRCILVGIPVYQSRLGPPAAVFHS